MGFKMINYRLLFIALFISLFTLMQCVEEPTLSPTGKRPYTALRVGNLTNNVAAFDVYVSGQLFADDVAQGSFVAFKDIESKNATPVAILNSANGDTLYSSPRDLAAYAELTWFLYGYDSDVDTAVTLDFRSLREGWTYLRESVSGDSLRLYVYHGIGHAPGDSAIDVTIRASLVSGAAETQNQNVATELSTGQVDGRAIPAGDYKVYVSDAASGTVVDSLETTFNSDMRYYVYFSGNMSAYNVTTEAITPPPARDK